MASDNWYDDGLEKLLNDIVMMTDVDRASVEEVYSALVNMCLIDYDIEKEIIWDRYFDGEE